MEKTLTSEETCKFDIKELIILPLVLPILLLAFIFDFICYKSSGLTRYIKANEEIKHLIFGIIKMVTGLFVSAIFFYCLAYFVPTLRIDLSNLYVMVDFFVGLLQKIARIPAQLLK